jgi:hypothetical protein
MGGYLPAGRFAASSGHWMDGRRFCMAQSLKNKLMRF